MRPLLRHRAKRREANRAGPPEGTTRVVIEHADPAAQWAMERVLRDRGYDVVTCGGPAVAPCSLLEEGRCELIETATVVVNCLGLDDMQARAVASETQRRYVKTPVVMALTALELESHRHIVDDREIMPATFVGCDLVSSIERVTSASAN